MWKCDDSGRELSPLQQWALCIMIVLVCSFMGWHFSREESEKAKAALPALESRVASENTAAF